VLRRNKILVRGRFVPAADKIRSVELCLLAEQTLSFRLNRSTTPETYLPSC